MKLIRTPNPWSFAATPFADAWVDRAFRDLSPLARWFSAATREGETYGEVAADLFEDDHDYHVRVELPGARKEEVAVRFENGMLHVAFTRGSAEDGDQFALSRAFRLPGPVNPEGIKARLEDGILTVSVPRAEEAKPRLITIE